MKMKMSGLCALMVFIIFSSSPVMAYDITLRGSINPEGSVRSVAVDGSTAYLAIADVGLQIYDLSTPPAKVKEYSLSNFSQPGGMLLRDSYLYLGGSGGIRIFDVAEPTSPTLKGTYPASQSDLLIGQGNLLFAVRSGQPGELRILNLDNPTSPTTASIYPMNFIGEAAVAGPWLYVAGGTENVIRVLDISDPTSPTQRAAFTHPDLHFPTSLSLANGKLFFTGDAGPMSFGILDVTNPANPTLLGNVNEPSMAESGWVRVYGEFAYLLDALGGGITIYDVSDARHPKKIFAKDIGLGSWAHGLIVNGPNLYAYGDQGLRILGYTVPVTLSDFMAE